MTEQQQQMTDEQIQQIRERAEKATPGPWHPAEGPNGEYEIWAGHGEYDDDWGELVYESVGEVNRWNNRNRDADIAFILNAREDIPALLAEVDRLRAENAAMHALLRNATA